jgi:hypothetical protein
VGPWPSKCQMSLFVCVTETFKFCKIAQLFLSLIFSGDRKFERIERKFKPQKLDRSHSFCPGCHRMSDANWHPFELAMASRRRFRQGFILVLKHSKV